MPNVMLRLSYSWLRAESVGFGRKNVNRGMLGYGWPSCVSASRLIKRLCTPYMWPKARSSRVETIIIIIVSLSLSQLEHSPPITKRRKPKEGAKMRHKVTERAWEGKDLFIWKENWLLVEGNVLCCSGSNCRLKGAEEGSGHWAHLTKITLISPESYLDKCAAALDINKSPDVVNCLGDSLLISVITSHMADDCFKFIDSSCYLSGSGEGQENGYIIQFNPDKPTMTLQLSFDKNKTQWHEQYRRCEHRVQRHCRGLWRRAVQEVMLRSTIFVCFQKE